MTSPYTTLPRSVGAYEDARAEVIRSLVVWLSRLWPPGKPMDPAVWFQRYAEAYADAVIMAQAEVAVLADWSVDDALEHQGMDLLPGESVLALGAYISTDGQGRPVMGQAYASAGQVGGAVEGAQAAGGDVAVALSQAWASVGPSLARATQTMISDTSRSVKSAKMLARDTGWVRVLTPPSCPRCAVLAGKYHRNPTADFNRHPGCDCTQIPVKDDDDPEFAGAFYDARDYFDSLTHAQQDKLFTHVGAQAIRDGADPAQVVNARRGMSTSTDRFGFRTVSTTEGTTKRGWASRYLRNTYNSKLQKQPGSRYRRMDRPRLMPEEIYRIARGDRDIAMSLLHKNGYYLDVSPTLRSNFSFYTRDEELAEATARASEKLRARGVTPRA